MPMLKIRLKITELRHLLDIGSNENTRNFSITSNITDYQLSDHILRILFKSLTPYEK